jgi:hypothetical protein
LHGNPHFVIITHQVIYFKYNILCAIHTRNSVDRNIHRGIHRGIHLMGGGSVRAAGRRHVHGFAPLVFLLVIFLWKLAWQ